MQIQTKTPREARQVLLLLGGQLVSQMGDKVYLLALSTWVMVTTGSALRMGTLLASATAAQVACGLFAGTLADRWNRKRVLVATDLGRGLVVLGVGVAFHLQALSFPWLVLSQVLVAALGALFNAALPAMLPQIAGEAGLSRANAGRALLSAVAGMAGPVLGSLLVLRAGCEATVYANAFSFFIAAAFTAGLAYRPSRGPIPEPLGRGFREGYAYLFSRRSLVAFLGIVVALHAFAGSLQVTPPLLANLMRGAYAKNLGTLEAFLGAGGAVAALALSFVGLRRRELAGLLSGILGLGCAYVGMACLLRGASGPGPWTCAWLLAVASGSILVAGTGYETYLQVSVENAMAGRVFGVMNALGSSTLILSMLVFSALAGRWGLGFALAGFGLAMAGLACGLLLRLGSGREEEAAGETA